MQTSSESIWIQVSPKIEDILETMYRLSVDDITEQDLFYCVIHDSPHYYRPTVDEWKNTVLIKHHQDDPTSWIEVNEPGFVYLSRFMKI